MDDDILKLVNSRNVLIVESSDLVILRLELCDSILLLINLILLLMKLIVSVLIRDRLKSGVLKHQLSDFFSEVHNHSFFLLKIRVHVRNSGSVSMSNLVGVCLL